MSRSRSRPTLPFVLLAVVVCAAPYVAVAQEPATSQAAAKDEPKLEAVDFKRLRELLPESVAQLKRGDVEAGRQSIGEMKVSQARAPYAAEGSDATAGVTIVDYGAMPGMAESVAPWQSIEIDNESDSDYSRTVTVAGHKGLETFSRESKAGTLTLIVSGRFVVTVEVKGLPPETLRQTAEALKLKELEAMGK